jgi:hypothetical protein
MVNGDFLCRLFSRGQWGICHNNKENVWQNNITQYNTGENFNDITGYTALNAGTIYTASPVYIRL